MRFLTPTLHRRPGLVVRRLGDPLDLFHGLGRASSCGTGLVPRLDLRTTDDAVVVEAELPGVRREDVELTLDEGSLVLKGEKRDRWSDTEGDDAPASPEVHRVERSFGAFERHVPLPVEVDEAAVKATFVDGILTVTLPKATVVETSRRIEIQGAD